MVSQSPQDGHPPSKIKNKVYYRLGNWHLDLIHTIKTRWQLPWMVSHFPHDGHPPSMDGHGHSPSKIYQKELFYKLGIWHLDLTHKIKTRWQMIWMVSHHHHDGHPPFKGWLSTIQNLTVGSVPQTWNLARTLNHKIKTRWQLPLMDGYHPLDGHQPSQGQGCSPRNHTDLCPNLPSDQPQP